MRYLIFLVSAWLLVPGSELCAQGKTEPWNEKQLVSTAWLASRIEQGDTNDLLVLSIGPDAIIKGSTAIGPTSEKENLEKLRQYLSDVPKSKEVVIYCGCCPFDRCPNIRPAFKVLGDMDFKKGKLLDVPQNIKVDWLDKGYPMNE